MHSIECHSSFYIYGRFMGSLSIHKMQEDTKRHRECTRVVHCWCGLFILQNQRRTVELMKLPHCQRFHATQTRSYAFCMDTYVTGTQPFQEVCFDVIIIRKLIMPPRCCLNGSKRWKSQGEKSGMFEGDLKLSKHISTGEIEVPYPVCRWALSSSEMTKQVVVVLWIDDFLTFKKFHVT